MELYSVWRREGRGEAGEKDRQGGRGENGCIEFQPFFCYGGKRRRKKGEKTSDGPLKKRKARGLGLSPLSFFAQGKGFTKKVCF